MSNEQIKLKPCPFCGDERASPPWDTAPHCVECLSCGAYGPFDMAATVSREKWNTRTADAEIADLRQKLAEAEARERELRKALVQLRQEIETRAEQERSAGRFGYDTSYHAGFVDACNWITSHLSEVCGTEAG